MKKLKYVFMVALIALIVPVALMFTGCDEKKEFSVAQNAIYYCKVDDTTFRVIRFKGEDVLEYGTTTDLDQTAYGNFGGESKEYQFVATQDNKAWNCEVTYMFEGEIKESFKLIDVTEDGFVMEIVEQEDTKTYSFVRLDAMLVEPGMLYNCYYEDYGLYLQIKFQEIENVTGKVDFGTSSSALGELNITKVEATYSAEKIDGEWTCEIKQGETTLAKLSNFNYDSFTMEYFGKTYTMKMA